MFAIKQVKVQSIKLPRVKIAKPAFEPAITRFEPVNPVKFTKFEPAIARFEPVNPVKFTRFEPITRFTGFGSVNPVKFTGFTYHIVESSILRQFCTDKIVTKKQTEDITPKEFLIRVAAVPFALFAGAMYVSVIISSVVAGTYCGFAIIEAIFDWFQK